MVTGRRGERSAWAQMPRLPPRVLGTPCQAFWDSEVLSTDSQKDWS